MDSNKGSFGEDLTFKAMLETLSDDFLLKSREKELIKEAKFKEYRKKYYKKPEVKARAKEYRKKYYEKPEVKARAKEYYERKKLAEQTNHKWTRRK